MPFFAITKYEIYLLLQKMASKGIGLIVISSEFNELINICSSIITFYKGKVTGEFNTRERKKEVILSGILRDNKINFGK